MDPFSALAVATSVVQFVDFSSKLISGSRKLYKSPDGQLEEHTDLHRVIKSLSSLIKDLERSLQSDGSKEPPPHEQELRGLCKECDRVAKELLEVLENLKAGSDKNKWRSCLLALRSIWSQERIDSLQQRVDRFRQQLAVNILVSLREEAYSSTQQHSDLSNQLTEATNRSDIVGKEFLKHIEESRRWQVEIIRAIRDSYGPDNDNGGHAFLRSNLVKFGLVSRADEFASLVLSTLKYREIVDRHDRIAEAHRKTFEWIFQQSFPGNASWTNFSERLQSQSSLYWITGKAGAGKSTLMKFIYDDARTHQLLSSSTSVPLVTAGFFFWNSGSQMQMSQHGLVQSLLHEILSRCQDYAPVAFPDRWEAFSLLGTPPNDPWTWSELLRGFRSLIEKAGPSKQFFFIIDGLDEYHGDHSELINFLKQLASSPNVKMCVSSRPWVVFEDAFKHSPSLLLQDLTNPDIKLFVSTQFYENTGYRELENEEPEYAAELVGDIVNKSSGVFLWVSLVVKSLLAGLTNGDRVADLQERLQSLPTDLEELFQKILDDLEPSYMQHASELFRIVENSKPPISLLDLAFADQGDADYAIRHSVGPLDANQLDSKLERMRRRLNSRCKGLLEVAERNFSKSSTVEYLHRTVKDFIQKDTTWTKLVAVTPPPFDPYLALCISMLLQLKTIEVLYPGGLWNLVTWCLQYILSAERTSIETRVRLLDELDKTAAILTSKPTPGYDSFLERHAKKHYGVNPYWTHIAHQMNPGSLQPETFMNLAVHCRLRWYVQAKLKQGVPVKQADFVVPLLFTAVFGHQGVIENSKDGRTLFDSTEPDLRLVEFLLENGADPNGPFRGMTPWQKNQTIIKPAARDAIASLLKRYGANVPGPNDLAQTQNSHSKKNSRWSFNRINLRSREDA